MCSEFVIVLIKIKTFKLLTGTETKISGSEHSLRALRPGGVKHLKQMAGKKDVAKHLCYVRNDATK